MSKDAEGNITLEKDGVVQDMVYDEGPRVQEISVGEEGQETTEFMCKFCQQAYKNRDDAVICSSVCLSKS